jgi:hypothetical protein
MTGAHTFFQTIVSLMNHCYPSKVEDPNPPTTFLTCVLKTCSRCGRKKQKQHTPRVSPVWKMHFFFRTKYNRENDPVLPDSFTVGTFSKIDSALRGYLNFYLN